ncbi:MAG: tRNA-(ms[2]io[6]A)-hydroxylase [Xanthomonadales bacterium]|nr:tRNA-(ms[2]io[6]A)-hydroxylase [Xanthomonadales bacterium]MDH3940947.1 tRNA-(ms[2]io[6]A)-hydroxylase [Xanthomonadales bacterium]MDH4000587.1 tRNA-(ms[2]io[6]A)-hydroxylase [Xanthomonadales bacterium]
MIELKYRTVAAWAACVVEDMDQFLPDHAAAEKKASSMAMTMVSHYPDRPELVTAMVDLAIEELNHFRAVVKFMRERELHLLPDEKDPYVNELRRSIRSGKDLFFMDRLLVAGIIEARGAERFGLVADALPEGRLRRFYRSITQSEEGHEALFIELAELYFDPAETRLRLDELLDIEADIIARLPLRPALH